MKRGTPVSFITKWGDRATGLYLGPSKMAEGTSLETAGHDVLSDNCYGEAHTTAGPVRCFMSKMPEPCPPSEAAVVRERMKGATL